MAKLVFVYKVISMDLFWFCNYVFLPWLIYVILCWRLSVFSCWDSFWSLCIKQLSSKDTRVSNILRMLPVWWANQHNKLSNMYPMFTNVPSFWIFLIPSITHRPAGNCCTRPPNTPLRNSILLWHAWWLIQKPVMKLTLYVTQLSFPIYTPFNLKFSLQLSHIEYYFDFLTKSFSMNCQVWFHCLQSHLSSDNKLEI